MVRKGDVKLFFSQALHYSSIPGFRLHILHGIWIFLAGIMLVPNASEGGSRWRDVCIPKQLERTRHQMLCFYFSVFAQSFGGMVARSGQRAKAKYLGFVGTTAVKNKPGSGSTSLKTQQESSRAFLALLLLPPSLHSSLLSVVRCNTRLSWSALVILSWKYGDPVPTDTGLSWWLINVFFPFSQY